MLEVRTLLGEFGFCQKVRTRTTRKLWTSIDLVAAYSLGCEFSPVLFGTLGTRETVSRNGQIRSAEIIDTDWTETVNDLN